MDSSDKSRVAREGCEGLCGHESTSLERSGDAEVVIEVRGPGFVAVLVEEGDPAQTLVSESSGQESDDVWWEVCIHCEWSYEFVFF